MKDYLLGEELPLEFYERPAEVVAKELLGAILIHHSNEGRTGGIIVETEAYLGQDDPACHSARGPTKRNQSMFGPGGRVYVYRIYGIHWCFNITADEITTPAAVLIRALEPVVGVSLMQERRKKNNLLELCSGPAKLAVAMGITGEHDGLSLFSGPIRVYGGIPKGDDEIVSTTRIGISKAADWQLRFYLKNNPYISRK
ncbi:MAG: DNA-3-methyladenine glycosylase [Clostridia bacterium]|jgi:DNA-3-methyladenine glycosylase|nr:DNA-3-methyladenine glycosylase [Clostridia bacterium]